MAESNFNGMKEQRTEQRNCHRKIISNHDKRNFSGQQWIENRKANEEEGQ